MTYLLNTKLPILSIFPQNLDTFHSRFAGGLFQVILGIQGAMDFNTKTTLNILFNVAFKVGLCDLSYGTLFYLPVIARQLMWVDDE